MLSKDEIVAMMKARDYTQFAEKRNSGNNSVDSIVFMFNGREDTYKRMTIPTYSCEVFMNGDFKLTYMIPRSINFVATPVCGSVENEDHFFGIVLKFENQIGILNKFYVP